MGQVKITRVDVEPGWCLFKPHDDEPPPQENTPFYLNDALHRWLVQNKDLISVRATLPIVQNGHTIAIHVWFD